MRPLLGLFSGFDPSYATVNFIFTFGNKTLSHSSYKLFDTMAGMLPSTQSSIIPTKRKYYLGCLLQSTQDPVSLRVCWLLVQQKYFQIGFLLCPVILVIAPLLAFSVSIIVTTLIHLITYLFISPSHTPYPILQIPYLSCCSDQQNQLDKLIVLTSNCLHKFVVVVKSQTRLRQC